MQWLGEFITPFADFAFGRILISEFRKKIDEELFDLRQSPELTEEQKMLSGIQLYLHEIEEGFREEFEVYMLVRSILDQFIASTIVIEEPDKYKFAPTPTGYNLEQVTDACKQNVTPIEVPA